MAVNAGEMKLETRLIHGAGAPAKGEAAGNSHGRATLPPLYYSTAFAHDSVPNYAAGRQVSILGNPVAAITAGARHTVARKSNGTLWAWGSNDRGQLGLGGTTNRTSPVGNGSERRYR